MMDVNKAWVYSFVFKSDIAIPYSKGELGWTHEAVSIHVIFYVLCDANVNNNQFLYLNTLLMSDELKTSDIEVYFVNNIQFNG